MLCSARMLLAVAGDRERSLKLMVIIDSLGRQRQGVAGFMPPLSLLWICISWGGALIHVLTFPETLLNLGHLSSAFCASSHLIA